VPEVLRIAGFRFFFGREGNEPPHIHVEQAERYAKFWLTPVALADPAVFAARNCAICTIWLRNIARALSSLGMSTLASKPLADAVDVAFTDSELVVTLVDGRRAFAPLEWFPRLLRATPAQRSNWRCIGRGIGIHWPDLDEDVSVKSILAS
jgi:hypothetical protein